MEHDFIVTWLQTHDFCVIFNFLLNVFTRLQIHNGCAEWQAMLFYPPKDYQKKAIKCTDDSRKFEHKNLFTTFNFFIIYIFNNIQFYVSSEHEPI